MPGRRKQRARHSCKRPYRTERGARESNPARHKGPTAGLRPPHDEAGRNGLRRLGRRDHGPAHSDRLRTVAKENRYSAPFGRNRHSLRPLHPLFRADSPQETPSPEERRNGERFLASFLHRFIQPSHPSEATAKRGASHPVGPDRGMPIKYRPFRSIRRPGSENRMFLPLTHYSDSGRISGVVFSYSPRTQRSPHRRTAPSENRTSRAPPPRPISDTDKALTPFLRSKDTAKPEHARLRTPPQAPGPFPDSGFSPLVMPATCSAPLPVAAHRTQGLSILPGGFSDTGRLPPARPVPRRKGTEKSVAPRPIRGGGNRTGNRRTGRGPCAPEPMFSGTERLDFPEKILILHNYDFVSSCRFVCITK